MQEVTDGLSGVGRGQWHGRQRIGCPSTDTL